MKPTRAQTFLLMALLCFFVSAWMFTRPQAVPPAELPKNPLPESGSLPNAEDPSEPELLPAVETTLARNPFQLPAPLEQILRDKAASRSVPSLPTPSEPVPPIDPPHLTLQGIFWGMERPVALIDRKIVLAGDRLGEARVVDVTPEGIRIFYRGGNFFYRPGSETIERITKGGTTS